MRPDSDFETTEDARKRASAVSPKKSRDLKARQIEKLKEIGEALRASGYGSLDSQAQALGLCRSTAWTVLQANHKSSGLSAAVISRMLAAPKLPPIVRAKILEYIEEKGAGLYGHCPKQRRRFVAALSDSAFATAAGDRIPLQFRPGSSL
jgi:hypothetical protein